MWSWYNTQTDGNVFQIYLDKKPNNNLYNLPVNTINFNSILPETGFRYSSPNGNWFYINNYGLKTHRNLIFDVEDVNDIGIIFSDNSTLKSSTNLSKTTDINTNTLEIDVNGKLNVIGGSGSSVWTQNENKIYYNSIL